MSAPPKPRRPWTPEGQLFLFEALIQLGQARFGGTWTGKEWTLRGGAGNPPSPPTEPKRGEQLKVRQPDGSMHVFPGHVRWPVDGVVRIIPYKEALQSYETEKDDLLRD